MNSDVLPVPGIEERLHGGTQHMDHLESEFDFGLNSSWSNPLSRDATHGRCGCFLGTPSWLGNSDRPTLCVAQVWGHPFVPPWPDLAAF